MVSLAESADPDDAEKFETAVRRYGATGLRGGLADGSGPKPLRTVDVEDAIVELLPSSRYDLIVTHGLWGEHTGPHRYDTVAKAVIALRESGRLSIGEIWMFAYEDGDGKYLPRPVADSDVFIRLPKDIYEQKHEILTETYGCPPDSFEVRTAPKEEAFWVIGAAK
jgi:hypothetical protein